MDERAQDEREFGVMGMMAGAAFMGKHLYLLSEYDHTDREGRRIADVRDVEVAEESLRTMLEFFELIKDEEFAKVRDWAVGEIKRTMTGFEYRRAHKLPGLLEQFLMARQQLVSGKPPSALDNLAKQPDAAGFVAQLRAEYTTFEEVMDEGGELDIDKLQTQIFLINHGLDLVDMDEAIGRWRGLKDLEGKLAGSKTLAAVQKREDLLEQLGQIAREFEADIADAAASSLNRDIQRLKQGGKIEEEDRGLGYTSLAVELRKKGMVVEMISEVLKRADLLTGGSGESDKTPVTIGEMTEDVAYLTKEIAALKDSLARLTVDEEKRGRIPILGNQIRKERLRVISKLAEVKRKQKQMEARIEIAPDYNKLVDFLASIREERR